MTDREFLSPGDVRDLAGGAVGVEAQQRALEQQGVPCKVVGRRVLVSRYHAREWLAGRHVAPTRGVQLEKVR